MKTIKWLIGAFFFIGMPFPVIFTNQPHNWWYAFVGMASAFIGSGIIFGFSNYKDRPYHFGDLSENPIKPKINQVWMGFFISCIVNLFFANMF
jgi:hypothetical protein